MKTINIMKKININTAEQVSHLVDDLFLHSLCEGSYEPPTIYIRLEGNDSLSILTLLDTATNPPRVYLIDVLTLGADAFKVTGRTGTTLKGILEDREMGKVFFDVGSDSHALFTHFGVRLKGVHDVQLMESAANYSTSRKYLSDLTTSIETFVLTPKLSWSRAREKGEPLFNPERGGSYEVFNQRPIPDDIISYCAENVMALPVMWIFYSWGEARRNELAKEETEKRVAASQKPEYEPNGPGRIWAPWNEEQHKILYGMDMLRRD